MHGEIYISEYIVVLMASCSTCGNMVKIGVLLMLALGIIALQLDGAKALQICNMDAQKLVGCLPAIRAPNPSPPTPGCCAALRTGDLRCLCKFKDSFLLRSFGVDPKLAVALPVKCELTPPPECSVP